MCTVSAIMDYGRREWPGLTPIVDPWINPLPPTSQPGATPFNPNDWIKIVKPEKDEGRLPTKAEMEAFLKLVKAAEEFDKKANQPHCEDPEKIKLLHAIEERLARLEQSHKRLEDRLDNPHAGAMIYGSSNLPSHLTIGAEQVQLGTVVQRAHKDSGLSVEDWNALSEVDREHRLVDAIAAMRREVAE
jgi:hypothetical protein